MQVLEVDPNKRRISLGLKQTQDNPWEAFLSVNPKGSTVEGPIRNITEFGLFIGLEGGVDGMVHLSDLDWTKSGDEVIKDYKKGDIVKAAVLDVDSQKERISLGIKQLAGDPIDALSRFKKGDVVTCEVIAVQENGIEVKVGDGEITAFVKRSDLSRDRSEQRPDRFNVGDKVDASVMNIDKAARRLIVSVKSLEIAEEKKAVAQYGSSDSGASLGDIFKAAIMKRETSDAGEAGADDAADDAGADVSEPETAEPEAAEAGAAEAASEDSATVADSSLAGASGSCALASSRRAWTRADQQRTCFALRASAHSRADAHSDSRDD